VNGRVDHVLGDALQVLSERVVEGARVRPGGHIKFGVETSLDVPRGLPATRADVR